MDIYKEQLDRVKSAVVGRLARFASVEESAITQSFLFHDGEFCGVRFVAGAFEARWLFTHSHVEFIRSEKVIDRLALDAESRAAA